MPMLVIFFFVLTLQVSAVLASCFAIFEFAFTPCRRVVFRPLRCREMPRPTCHLHFGSIVLTYLLSSLKNPLILQHPLLLQGPLILVANLTLSPVCSHSSLLTLISSLPATRAQLISFRSTTLICMRGRIGCAS